MADGSRRGARGLRPHVPGRLPARRGRRHILIISEFQSLLRNVFWNGHMAKLQSQKQLTIEL